MSVEASGGGASDVGHQCSIPMDQIIKESSGQRSSEEVEEIEDSSDQRFNEEEKKQFDSFDEMLAVVKGRDANPKIQKVPSILRNKFEKYFLPKVFSFGPYADNQDRSATKMADQIKFNLVAEFLELNGVKKEDLYGDIKNQIQKLRNCYNDLTYDDHVLAWMFLVDGCAILQFMYISANLWEGLDSSNVTWGINTNYVVFLEQDLFLLENQLPYQLLQLIIQHASKQQKTADDRTSKEEKLLKSIYKFIFYCFKTPKEWWYKNKIEILEDLKDDHVHLLDLLRKKLIQPLHQKSERHDLIGNIICWIVDLFDKLKCTRNESERDRFIVPHYNIGNLGENGINLKPSKTSCVGDISFRDGTLKLSPITVDESTTRMLLNMLGYEMCPDFQNESEVSTYMYLLDKLIDRTQDVEELREKNILRNELGSDEEVVNLFNEIGKHLRPNSKYDEVKRNIDNYFDNKRVICLHQISNDIHQYFRQRWSVLAFIGALLAVISTIFQSVLTFLAYQDDSKKGI